MCDESYAGQALGGATMPSQPYQNLKDADSRIRQQTQGRQLAHGPSVRRQLEQRIHQTQVQEQQHVEALKLLTPEVEKMIEAFRALNRVGLLQL
jgi:hypothetical protein